MSITYAAAGVHIQSGEDASKIFYEAARQTWQNRRGRLGEVIVPFDDFSGVRAIDVSQLPPGTVMNISFDTVGTKSEIAERVDNHSTIAFDLLAMVVDDAVVRGAEPVLVGSNFEVNNLISASGARIQELRQLAQGYVAAAAAANVAIVNGEVAEIGDRVHGYGSFNYNWGAAVVWFARQDRLFTGKEIQVGDAIVAFKEAGLRCNGISLVRQILTASHGPDWHLVPYQGTTLGQAALQPSQIYCRAVVAMTGGVEGEPKATVHGVAHITGGGIPGKLGRVLKPSGLGARLTNVFPSNPLLHYCQQHGQVSDAEAYCTWNMGQGMLVVTPNPASVIAIAQQQGITAQLAGEIISQPGITIANQGYQQTPATLIFTS